MQRAIAAALIIALAACSSGAGGSSSDDTSSAANGPAVAGGPAPSFDLPTSTGGKINFDSLKGKPVYLNFFATWCGPCQEEATDIGNLARKYAKQGVVVIGVDEVENAVKAEGFRKQHNLPYPAVIDPGSLRDAYNVNGLPVHVFIDKTGKIATLREGEMSKQEIDAALRSLVQS